jgi:Na+-translocating ferredoxin:NAD+ oxidoreductase subunit B
MAMSEQVYKDLARHLNKLPAGFPPSETGADIRVLTRLFTPEEASLALHLNMLAEPSKVIARRAGLPLAEVEKRLDEMARKGLVYCNYRDENEPKYMATQWVIGIFEFQVNKLTPEVVHDIEAYHEEIAKPEFWMPEPQMRTIPVGESIPVQQDILIHEQAEELIKSRTKFAVAPCICRQKNAVVGSPCDRPLETCLVFNNAADFYIRNDMAREIDLQEALEIIRAADAHGLVLQPGNAKKVSNICCCCGDCCEVLQIAKRHPQPATVLSSPYVAQLDIDECIDCYTCTTRCQMEALEMGDEGLILYTHRCIGCGLCVTTCTTGALTLTRKPEDEQPYVPRDLVDLHMRRGRARGVLGTGDMLKTAVSFMAGRLRG